jgi:hypothetical protein
MANLPARYQSGEIIRPGDRVRLAGLTGRIVFVLGTEGVPEEWRYLEAEHGAGCMLDVERMGYIFQHGEDEDLKLIARGS